MLTSGSPSMKLIDVSVPLDAQLPTYPHNTPFSTGTDQAAGSRRQLERVDAAHECAHRHARRRAAPFFRQRRRHRGAPLELLIGRAQGHRGLARAGVAAEDLAAIDLVRGHPRADQDAQLAAVGIARVPHRLRRRHRIGREASRRARHQGGRRRLPVGRTVQDAWRAGAPRAARRAARSSSKASICARSSRASTKCSACRFASSDRDGAPARVVLRRS